jgi:putative transposase
VTWKDQAIRVRDGCIQLPNGRGQPNLILPLPARLQHVSIRKVELLWRADHYELALTIEQPPERPPLSAGQTAGVDLGEINPAAVVTEAGQALIINGRLLRHHKQLRNKRHAAYQERMARCRKGSRRWKRLKRQHARASAKLYRQQRNHLHQASRKVVDFAVQQGVNRLAVGDVRDVADGVDKGTVANQKLSQWPHGQFMQYLSYKARRQGIAVEQIPKIIRRGHVATATISVLPRHEGGSFVARTLAVARSCIGMEMAPRISVRGPVLAYMVRFIRCRSSIYGPP